MIDWGTKSYVYGELVLRCGCGAEESFEFHDIGWMFTLMEARNAGWRFSAEGNKSCCKKCGLKRYPELYGKHPYHQVSDASQRNSPRVVRRLRKEDGKHDEKEVRKPRRVRGR